MSFGEILKSLRIAKGLTLRQCCHELGVDPSNWSKIERKVNPAPKDITILERWAKYFGVHDQKRQEFFDSAALSRSELPPDMASDERVIGALPAFFRAARGSELKGNKLKQFIADIRAIHSPDKGTQE